jgi:hypothetical protein
MDALKDIPTIEKPLQTIKGDAFLQKTDIFKRIMWFGYRGEESNWIPVPVDRVQEILALNTKGERPQTIDSAESAKIELELEKGSGPLNADLDKMDRKYGGGKKKFEKPKLDRPDFKPDRKEFVRPERNDFKQNSSNQRPERKETKQEPNTDLKKPSAANALANQVVKVQGENGFPHGQKGNQRPPQGQKGNKPNPNQQRSQGQSPNGEGQQPRPQQNLPRPQGNDGQQPKTPNVQGQQTNGERQQLKPQNQPRVQGQGQVKSQNQPRPQGNSLGQPKPQNQPRPQNQQAEGGKKQGEPRSQRPQNQQGGENKNNQKPNNTPPENKGGEIS